MFIGQEKEIRVLENMYQKDTFEFMVIYGRRRVGKTTLINEFIKEMFWYFFQRVDLQKVAESLQKNLVMCC